MNVCSLSTVINRDVTNFVFAFKNIRILTSFQLFDIGRIVGNISGECEYFIVLSLIELY